MLNFYLYSISAISLTAFYFATLVVIGSALRLVAGVDTTEGERLMAQESLAGGAGFLILALPLWWLHWRWLRQQFEKASGRAVSWHRFYLFTIVCLNAVAMLIGGSLGLTGLLRISLGIAGTTTANLERTGVFLASLILSSALWLHHWRQFRGGPGELRAPLAAPETTG